MLDEFVKNKMIFCYGAGEYGRVVRLYLQSVGIDIDGFVVSDIGNKTGVKVLSIPVYGLEEFPYRFDECAFVISLSESIHDVIEEKLRSVGCGNIYRLKSDEVASIRRKIQIGNLKIDRSGVLVLLYHRIINLENDVWGLAIDPELFEHEMAYLNENYHIIGLNDDWDSASDRSVVITFDDGYIDNYQNALPIVEKYKLPVTFYVCTGNIGTDREFWWDELERIVFSSSHREISWNGMNYLATDECDRTELCRIIHRDLKNAKPSERKSMFQQLIENGGGRSSDRKEYRSIDKEELKRMADSELVNIGAHTVTHSCMALLGENELRLEVTEPKTMIEEITGKEVVDFSYPFGNASDRGKIADAILKEEGYKTIATTAGGVARNGNRDKYEIPRNSVMPNIRTVDDFARFIDVTYAMSDGVLV